MVISHLPVLLVTIPILASLLILAAGWYDRRFCHPISLMTILFQCGASIVLLFRVMREGTIHYYVEPVHVAAEMEALFQWIQESFDQKHPVIISSVAHYNLVRIHPFDDGNGRGARLLMNLILIRKGYAPAVIRKEQRRSYLESLSLADQGNLEPFTELVARSLLNTQQMILEDFNGNSGC